MTYIAVMLDKFPLDAVQRLNPRWLDGSNMVKSSHIVDVDRTPGWDERASSLKLCTLLLFMLVNFIVTVGHLNTIP